MKIYVVKGRTGNGEDHFEWLVVAFKIKSKALEHIDKCQKRFKELYNIYSNDIPTGLNEYDRKMNVDYDSYLSYRVDEIFLVD